jgi:hypothetical protein
MRDEKPYLVELPIACTLGVGDRAERMARWRALSPSRRPGYGRETDELIIRYQLRSGVREELEALVAAERECCAFADWEVSLDAGDVLLRVRSTPDGVAAIAAMFEAE